MDCSRFNPRPRVSREDRHASNWGRNHGGCRNRYQVASWKRRGFVASAARFALVSLPQIVYVSRLKGAPTIGDVARLTYGWYTACGPRRCGTSVLVICRLCCRRRMDQSRSCASSRPRPIRIQWSIRSTVRPRLPCLPGTTPRIGYHNVRVPPAWKETLTAAGRNTLAYGRHLSLFILAARVPNGPSLNGHEHLQTPTLQQVRYRLGTAGPSKVR